MLNFYVLFRKQINISLTLVSESYDINCYLYIIDLLELVATSRNYTELLTAWKGWRDATGKKMKEKYDNFVRLSNEGVQQLGKNKL
jgi:peptidyl-dipeptidase A